MELDDLKQRWAERDRKLDQSIRLNSLLLRASTLSKAETAIRRLSRLLRVELLLNVVAAGCLGPFIAEHLTEARFLLPAVVLDLGVILLIVAGVHQLVAIGSLDYSAPIVAIQKRLESLRFERIRVTKLTLLASPLLWTPLLIVTLKGLFDVDAYASLDVAWLAANVLVGVAVIVAGVWASRRYADRMERSPLLQRLMRNLAGHSLAAAAAFLGALAQFEQEETRA